MFQYAATTLPTRANPKATPIAHGSASSLSEARNLLSRALMSAGIHGNMAVRAANGAHNVWTDFPEAGITVYITEG